MTVIMANENISPVTQPLVKATLKTFLKQNDPLS